MSALTGWRLPLRLARRDALRHRGRSVLVLVMIALPVLAVTAADVAISTADVSDTEGLDRRLGSSAALVQVQRGLGRVRQAPDPEKGMQSTGGPRSRPVRAPQLAAGLGAARLLEVRRGDARVTTAAGGQTVAAVTEVDLTDPLTDGLVTLNSGRLPTAPSEVVINQALADKGYAVGDVLNLIDGRGTAMASGDPRVVGIAESTSLRDQPFAAGPLGVFGVPVDSSRSWLVDGAPVTWETVRALNRIGVLVTSRSVISDPPPASELPEGMGTGGVDSATVTVLVLIVVMALIEVVLLAGPAFAVGARRQQRSLALIAAAGGTPVQSSRVVMAAALVLGGAAAVVGVALGLVVARLLVPALQTWSSTWFGPFQVPWLHLVGIAGLGLLSAFLAAVVPARIASRQDIVAVLAGRRGDRRPSLRSPLLGLVLLGAGIAGSAYGAVGASSGETLIAGSAILAVLGMILLVPVVVAGLARLSARLPLVLRYAVRDAARHRTRTVPAVAAVAATVAGVVALGIGMASDEAEGQATYVPTLASGMGVVTSYDPQTRWERVREVIVRVLPEATVTEQRGVPTDEGESFSDLQVKGVGVPMQLVGFGSALGAQALVSDHRLPVGLTGFAEDEVAVAERTLRSGGVVAFASAGVKVSSDRVRVVRTEYPPSGGRVTDRRSAELPVAFVHLEKPWDGPQAVLSSAAARKLGVEPTVVSLALTGTDVTEQQEEDLNEALLALSDSASVYVERGYQIEDETVIVQFVLLALGAVLMLGGTLTATFLAISDARPDLATLSAVGASPRTRRGVAAAYAVVVGAVGAVLGAGVGFIPGIAVTYPLTSHSGDTCEVSGGSGSCQATGEPIGPFLDVPWLMLLTLVVALPLLTALVVGLFSRSRLPLVARLD